jgi:NAD(P)-dependent dehydrogenase (short-subunit alcohol dehydrogenase family)
MRLKGTVSLITGAGRGIGREIALRFIEEGSNLTVIDIDSRAINSLTTECKERGAQIIGIVADVTKVKDVQRAVSRTLSSFDGIDILVNNAGSISFAPIFDLTEEQWDRIFAVNVKGVFLFCQAVIPHLREKKQGKIVNIASIAGKTGGPFAAHYCASKGAVISFTQALAQELAPYRINVNAICPGFIETEMLEDFEKEHADHLGADLDEIKRAYLQKSGWHRMGIPLDVAGMAVFLASKEADYITGQAINVCAAGEFH